jgi:hypothetical protein
MSKSTITDDQLFALVREADPLPGVGGRRRTMAQSRCGGCCRRRGAPR